MEEKDLKNPDALLISQGDINTVEVARGVRVVVGQKVRFCLLKEEGKCKDDCDGSECRFGPDVKLELPSCSINTLGVEIIRE